MSSTIHTTATAREYPTAATFTPDIHPGTPGNMKIIAILLQVRRTAKAVLVRDPAGVEHWLPLSIVHVLENSRYVPPVGTRAVSVTMPVWLARKVWGIK